MGNLEADPGKQLPVSATEIELRVRSFQPALTTRTNPLPAGHRAAVFGVEPHRYANAADFERTALHYYVGEALYDINRQGGVVDRPGYAGGRDNAADSFFPERSDHAFLLTRHLTLLGFSDAIIVAALWPCNFGVSPLWRERRDGMALRSGVHGFLSLSLVAVFVAAAACPAMTWQTTTAGLPHRARDVRPPLTVLMYMVDSPASIASFREHAGLISIVAPQCFTMDADGFISGEVPPAVVEIARAHRVALMPLVTNRGFQQDLMHTVLDNPESRARAIRYLLYYALRDGYVGFQFDYENIRYTYRDRFTLFFREAAVLFHRHGLQLSAALVGRYSDDRTASSPGGFDNWSGVYDYGELARSADFLSIMAYPQHAGFSGPGALAAVPWVRQIADYTMQQMPAGKISLGVPLYGERWTAVAAPAGTDSPAPAPDFVQDNQGTAGQKWKARSVPFSVVSPLLAGHAPDWDEVAQAHHLSYAADGSRTELWYEDALSLAPKLQLAAAGGFAGISGWVLGQEDPAIWVEIEKHYAVRRPPSRLREGNFDRRAAEAARVLRAP